MTSMITIMMMMTKAAVATVDATADLGSLPGTTYSSRLLVLPTHV